MHPDLITEIMDNLSLEQIYVCVNNDLQHSVKIQHDAVQTFLTKSDGSIVASLLWDEWQQLDDGHVISKFPVTSMFSVDHSNVYQMMATTIKVLSNTKHLYQNQNFTRIYHSLIKKSTPFSIEVICINSKFLVF